MTYPEGGPDEGSYRSSEWSISLKRCERRLVGRRAVLHLCAGCRNRQSPKGFLMLSPDGGYTRIPEITARGIFVLEAYCVASLEKASNNVTMRRLGRKSA